MQRCPTCGSVVKVTGDPVEGTMHYEPAPAAELQSELSLSLAREQRLREENERLKRLLKQRGKDAADAEDLEAWYQQALRAIEGPSDDWLWMEPYRAAGGGYEGLQAIASFALSSVPDGERS